MQRSKAPGRPRDRNERFVSGRDDAESEDVEEPFPEFITAAEAARRPGETRSVNDVIDELGFGRFHFHLLMVCGAGWGMDALHVTSLSFLLIELKNEPGWNIDQSELGLLASAQFAGMGVGSTGFGLFSDWGGRKPAFMLTVLTASIFGTCSAFAPSFLALLGFQFMTGIGVGGNLPVDFSMFTEFIPASTRGFYTMLLALGWCFGELLSLVIAMLVIPVHGWRGYLLISSLLSLVILVLRKGIPESPRYLMVNGRYKDAWRSFQVVAAVNRRDLKTDMPVVLPSEVNQADGDGGGERATDRVFRPTPPPLDPSSLKGPPPKPLRGISRGVFGQITALFTPELWATTTLVWIMWACDKMANFGLILHLPTYLSLESPSTDSLFRDLLFSALATLPSVALCAFTIERWGRRQSLASFFICMCITTLVFGRLVWLSTTGGQERSAFLVPAAMATRFFGYSASCVIYVYTTEVYPTVARSTGMGMASLVKRVTGVIVPIVGAALIERSAALSIYVWALAAGLGGVAAAFCPFETSGVGLNDSLQSERPGITEQDAASEKAPLLPS